MLNLNELCLYVLLYLPLYMQIKLFLSHNIDGNIIRYPFTAQEEVTETFGNAFAAYFALRLLNHDEFGCVSSTATFKAYFRPYNGQRRRKNIDK